MTEPELQQQRAAKWRLDGNAIRTLEDARSFVSDTGLCLMYPERSLPSIPTLIGAYAGSDGDLPDAKHAFADPRAQEATELMVRLLREKSAYELRIFEGTNLIVSADLFPFFYSLVSDRNPKAPPKAGAQGASISPLATNVFEAIQKHGPAGKEQLRQLIGREPSNAALDRALNELWSLLKITRVDYREGQGALWDVLYRWSPKKVKEGLNISGPEAISALLCRYLETAIAATQDEVELFFSHLTSRARVREAVNALLAARELGFVAVGSRTLLRLAPAPPERRRIHG